MEVMLTYIVIYILAYACLTYLGIKYGSKFK